MATASPVGCAESFTAGIRAVPFPVHAPFAPPPPPIYRPTHSSRSTLNHQHYHHYSVENIRAPAVARGPADRRSAAAQSEQPCNLSCAQHATQAGILQVLALYFLSNMWITMSQDALFKVRTALPYPSLVRLARPLNQPIASLHHLTSSASHAACWCRSSQAPWIQPL